MKYRLAAVLSLCGVLAAGSAAALVNTRVLSGTTGAAGVQAGAQVAGPTGGQSAQSQARADGSARAAGGGGTSTSGVTTTTSDDGTSTSTSTPGASTTSTPGATSTSAAGGTSTSIGSTTSTSEPGGTSTSISVEPPVPLPSQAVYQLADAGNVVLDTFGDELTIAAVNLNSGWTVTRSEQEDVNRIEVRVESAAGEVRFEARLTLGVITTDLDINEDNSGPGNGDDGHDDDSSGPGGGDDSDDSSGGDDSSGSGGGDNSSGSGGGDDSSGSGSGGDDSSGSGSGNDDD